MIRLLSALEVIYGGINTHGEEKAIKLYIKTNTTNTEVYKRTLALQHEWLEYMHVPELV